MSLPERACLIAEPFATTLSGGCLTGCSTGGRVGQMVLCTRDRMILDVERSWWLEGRSKTEVVRARLSLSLARYNQLLGDLMASDEAEAYDPLVVRRLRRSRDRRRLARMGMTPARGRWDP